jgi:hypothetical protein
LDANGQGVPYATFGFAAQIAEVEVDIDLGTVAVLHVHAAHDVGRAINPCLVEGQIHGGIAQGLGMALMEEYISGRTDNLHDYLIPTVGDMPQVTIHIVEDGRTHRTLRRQGRRRACDLRNAAGDPERHPRCGGCPIGQDTCTPDRVRESDPRQGRTAHAACYLSPTALLAVRSIGSCPSSCRSL